MSATNTTVTFPNHWHLFMSTQGLTDISNEVALMNRCAYSGTQAQWDIAHTALIALQATQSGALRGSTTAALSRITTTAMLNERLAVRTARKARRAARNA